MSTVDTKEWLFWRENWLEQLVYYVDLFVDNDAHTITTHDLLRKAEIFIETFQIF